MSAEPAGISGARAELMPRLSSQEFAELRSALLDVFDTMPRVSELVREARNLTLDRVALGNNLDDVMTNLMGRAQSELWLPTLITTAVRLQPTCQALENFRLQWSGMLDGQVGDPYKALMLPGRMVFIDRIGLRDSLRSLERDSPDGVRVLVVDGADRSGKTYSVHFMSYLSAVRQTFRCAYVDLQRLPVNSSGQVGAFELGCGISTALIGETYPPPRDKNLNTWIDRYCEWLETNLRSPAERLRRQGIDWIVIDHFRKVGADSTSLDLVAQLAMRTYRNLDSLRLILLNYGDRDWLQARVIGSVEHETIPIIDNKQLVHFFAEFHTEEASRRGESAPPDVLRPRVVESVKMVIASPADAGVSPLERIGRATWNEIQRIRNPARPRSQISALAEAALEELESRSSLANDCSKGGGNVSP